MSISALTALGLVENFHFLEITLLVAGNHHLGDTFTIVDDKVLLREVDEDNPHLTAIVGINGTRSIQHSQTVLQCQALSVSIHI